jgi:hypothetical protein
LNLEKQPMKNNNSAPLAELLENYDPAQVNEAFKAYYMAGRKDTHGIERIWIEEANRPVPDFFGASGRRYTIFTPDMGIATGRAHGLRKAYDAVIADMPLQSIVHSLSEIKKQTNAAVKSTTGEGWVELAYTIQSSIARLSDYNRKWHMAVEAATFFILREGEDKAVWDERIATEKMEDWKNINEQDFFFCCIMWGMELTNKSSAFLARLMAQAHGAR